MMARKIGVKTILIVALNKLSFLFPDKLYLRLQFRLRMGYGLNLDNPKTFSEKLQWLKLHDRNTLYSSLVDKYEVKAKMEKVLGNQYIIPTLGVWNDVEDIDVGSLPNQFVLKTTHGGGGYGVIVCKDKMALDWNSCKRMLKKGMRQDIYLSLREWPYKNIRHRIIAEQFMCQEDGTDLADYKFFCFNGKPTFVYLRHEASGETRPRMSFFTMDWTFAPFHNPDYLQFDSLPDKPLLFNQMKEIAAKISEGYPFLRVDLYIINNQIYFSEVTFYPGSGMTKFLPSEWDRKLGDMLVLPSTPQS